jgi:hypothetical protein
MNGLSSSSSSLFTETRSHLIHIRAMRCSSPLKRPSNLPPPYRAIFENSREHVTFCPKLFRGKDLSGHTVVNVVTCTRPTSR